MARSTPDSQPNPATASRRSKALVQDASPARRIAETAVTVAVTPFIVVQQLLPREQPAVYYGGVAAAAVAGLIEWPVAAALGAAVWIARTNPPPPRTRASSTSA